MNNDAIASSLMSSRGISFNDKKKMDELTSKIVMRFHVWLVNKNYTDVSYNQISNDIKVKDSSSTDTNYRNERFKLQLLECEKARKDHEDAKRLEYEKVKDKVTKRVNDVLESQLKSFLYEAPLTKLFDPIPDFSYFLSVAYKPTLSFKQLYPIAILNKRISDKILNIARNHPSYTKNKERSTQINDTKVAISQIGIDNCRLLFPIIMADHLSAYDDELKLVRKKIWKHLLICSHATCERLAEGEIDNPEQGILLGTIRQLGLLVIVNHFKLAFEDSLLQVMKEYRDHNQMLEYFSCSAIKLPFGILPKLLQKHEKHVVKRLISHIDWGIENVHLQEALREDLNDISVENRSEFGVALAQARAFSIFDSMDKNKLFPTKFSRHWFTNVRLSGPALSNIQKKSTSKLFIC